VLRQDVGLARLDHRQLVAADAARDDLLAAGLGIEAPSRRLPDERHRERPLFVAEDQSLGAVGAILQVPAFRGGRSEHLAPAPGAGRV